MKVSAVSGDTAVMLAAGLVAGLGLVWAIRRAQGAADGLSRLPAQIWGAITGAVDGVGVAIDSTRQAVADSNPTNPGYQLPAGWYTVHTRYGDVVTRNPDSFKTINPYDTLGLIDP